MGKSRTNVFFDMNVDGAVLGRIEMELYDEICPRTSANFRALCIGKHGKSKRFGLPLCYSNTFIHRVIPKFVIQGGDMEFRNDFDKMGFGGESIYGRTFEDENFEVKHVISGTLSMANSGPNTNGSQFFITLAPSIKHLDGKHVVFGRVVKGMDVIRKIENLKTGKNDKPLPKVEIVKSGECEFINVTSSDSSSSSSSSSEEEVVLDENQMVGKKRKRDSGSEDESNTSVKKKFKIGERDLQVYERIRKMNTQMVVKGGNSDLKIPERRVYKGRGSMRYYSSEDEDVVLESKRNNKSRRNYGGRGFSGRKRYYDGDYERDRRDRSYDHRSGYYEERKKRD